MSRGRIAITLILTFGCLTACNGSLLLREGDPTAFYALALLSPGSGPPSTSGRVKSFQKISDTQGNFDGTLDDNDFLGTSVAAIGDLDGDGVTDLAVGAENDDDGNGDRGAVWILFMNVDGTVKSHQKISDTAGNFTGNLLDADRLGGALASLGDLDGDGVGDIVVGAKDDDDGGIGGNRGALWILFLNTDGTVKSHQKISDTAGNFTGGLEIGDHFGASVAVLGDVNKDGVTDIAAGAFFDDDGGAAGNRGAVWILFLNTDGTVKSHQKISATQGNFTGNLDVNDRFGDAVGGPGDLNGDGTPDLVVGMPEDTDDGSLHGSLWVLFLNPNGDGTVASHQKISNTQGNFAGTFVVGERFGRAIAAPGDLDGDGIIDLVAGTLGDPGDGGDQRGSVYVLFMNGDGTVKSHQKISDTEGNFTGVLDDGDNFGVAITAPGDLNGDGIPDLVVGARLDDDGGIGEAQRGAVWILNLDE